MFRALSRPSSGAQWLQWQPLVLTSYRGDSRAVFVVGPYCAVNAFNLGYKNQSVYTVSGTSRCLFSDKYKTQKYSVSRAYNCWMLNCWCITWPVGFKRLRKPVAWFHFCNQRLWEGVDHMTRLLAEAILTLRRLMSHIYGAPILDVSRSYTTTQHSR